MISEASNWRTDPYRILFPIGYCLLVLGLGVWSLEPLGAFTRRETLHALLLANGFLFAFAAGILLSEVPRANSASHPGAFQLTVQAFSLLALGAAALAGRFAVAYAFHGLAALTLATTLARSLPRAGSLRNPGSALAFTASLFAIAGAASGGFSEAGLLPPGFGRAAALAGFQGFSLLFVLACIRWTWEPGANAKPLAIQPLAVWLGVSLGLELASAFLPQPDTAFRLAYAARAAWIAYYLRRPAGFASLFADLPVFAWCIRAGSMFILAGAILAVVFPDRALTFDHIGFLAGFSWIAVSAATGLMVRRLAPSRRRAGTLLAALAGSALLGAVATRTLAMDWDTGKSALLPLAAALALFPLLVWAITVFPTLAAGKEDARP